MPLDLLLSRCFGCDLPYIHSVKFQPFRPGDVIARLEGLTVGPKAYSSVQCGTGNSDHVELNSDLLYSALCPPTTHHYSPLPVNHSCEPNVVVDVSSSDRRKWHVRAVKDIHVGDPVCFFYPSTEWDMEQPFDCICGTRVTPAQSLSHRLPGTQACLKTIKGARYLSREELGRRNFINQHIWTMAQERDDKGRNSSIKAKL